jgi:hypothetical protein
MSPLPPPPPRPPDFIPAPPPIDLHPARPRRDLPTMAMLVAVGAILGAAGMYLLTRSDSSATPAFRVTPPTVDVSQICAIDQRTILTAVEAYMAYTGNSPASLDELVPTFLREVPSNWVFTPGSPPTIVGIGLCDGM